jgi:hypothetical protein
VNADRARRVGDNEALYRLVNEQIQDLNEAFGPAVDDFAVVCECGRLDCQEQITVTRRAYEEIRADPARFILKPGHGMEDVEAVVDSRDDYGVVAKKPGEPERRAIRTDPRS